MSIEKPQMESEPEPTEKERELASTMIKALSENDPEFFHDLAGEMVEEPDLGRDGDFEKRKTQEFYNWTKEALEKRGNVPVGSEESFDLDEDEKVQDMIEKVKNELLDESKEHYTNVRRNTPREVFYRVLAEDYPQLGVSIEEKATDREGKKLEDRVEVKTKPYESDRGFIYELSRHPVIQALTRNLSIFSDKLEAGKELERKGIIPEGTMDRVAAWWCEERKKETPEKELPYEYERLFPGIDVEPISEEELKSMIRKVVDREIEEVKGI